MRFILELLAVWAGIIGVAIAAAVLLDIADRGIARRSGHALDQWDARETSDERWPS